MVYRRLPLYKLVLKSQNITTKDPAKKNTCTIYHYLTPGGVKNVIYNFGCVKMQVLENGEI